MEFKVTHQKIESLRELIRRPKAKGRLTPRNLAKIAGKIISMGIAIGTLTRLFTRQMYGFIQKRRHWDITEELSAKVTSELNFWLDNLQESNGLAIRLDSFCSRILYCDASSYAYGGHLIHNLGTSIAHGKFSDAEKETSSTNRELLAVKRVLVSFGQELAGNTITLYTDNSNVVQIINNGSTKQHLQAIELDIYNHCVKTSLILKTKWIPREFNQTADALSKMKDSDDWSIDAETFEYIQSQFGVLTIDRFADNLNTKTKKFNSRYYCPGTLQVDAFATNWAGEFNWLSPPVKLIGKVIRHMENSKAKGALFVPEWRSSYFWPLLTNDGHYFKHFC